MPSSLAQPCGDVHWGPGEEARLPRSLQKSEKQHPVASTLGQSQNICLPNEPLWPSVIMAISGRLQIYK